MAEELVLTEPKVEPEKVTDKFKVVSIILNSDTAVAIPDQESGNATITLKNNLGGIFTHMMVGAEAQNFIKFVNTGNFSTKSLNRRILEKLSNDGILPGTVTGTPETPTSEF